jgi:hypothetical protein
MDPQGSWPRPKDSGPANNNNAWGVGNKPTGSVAPGPLSTEYSRNVTAVPAPGTIVIPLNGRVEVDVTANYSSLDRNLNANGTPNGFKLNLVGVSNFIRLYPGFDGVVTNGVHYGASAEIRARTPQPRRSWGHQTICSKSYANGACWSATPFVAKSRMVRIQEFLRFVGRGRSGGANFPFCNSLMFLIF